ncbi:trypsin-like peptidase domain-containing protein [Dermacoccus sp. PAMC28757]|uniref:trypsin-like peptidase domain-containing protein n=1 Tax=Dermacoccus sp. PAMC28757 TaxID=2762331 RepID=UPI00164E8D64|nr:trypsin-like peptidase domain-containing protein [Dermacoccus sp. PAMC28757]QNK52228.1 trypsin-like peptidase domain-containing protein [Dermacoccus sp. PAMC28757]
MRAQTPSEQLILAAVQPRVVDAHTGTDISYGSGFLLGVRADSSERVYYALVTNKHVRELGPGQQFRVRLPQVGTSGRTSGASFDVDLTSNLVVPHPDQNVDVLVVILEPNVMRKSGLRVLSEEMLYNPAEDDPNLDAIVEVTIIGFPNGTRNTSTHLGMVMRGVTASPIEDLYSGLRGFALDASVVGGSSGSMVIVGARGALTPDRSGNVILGNTRTIIAGIVARTHVRQEKVHGATAVTPDVAPYVSMPYGLGIAFNGTTIKDVCDEVRRVAEQSSTPDPSQ